MIRVSLTELETQIKAMRTSGLFWEIFIMNDTMIVIRDMVFTFICYFSFLRFEFCELKKFVFSMLIFILIIFFRFRFYFVGVNFP